MQTILPVSRRFFSFGMRDLPVNLGQGLEAAHRKQRMPESDDDRDESDLRPERSLEPSQPVVAERK